MKTYRSDPTNTNTVPVLDADDSPLMPTRPSRARRLMRAGRAEKAWVKGLFAIRMRDVSAKDADTEVDGVDLNVDPGAKATGMAVTSDASEGRRCHAAIELQHRGNRVKNRMDSRHALRRGRRSRLRNRPPRFDNRTRPDGWLPPSLRSRLENTMTWVERLKRLYPIRHVRVETAVFDTQLMQNAEVVGEEYQRGSLLGWQIRSYVFHRDGRKCVYCGSANKERYEIDHVVPKSAGGTDRVSNLVISCRECNADKGNRSVREFLSDRLDRLVVVRRVQGSSLTGAAHMNVILPTLLQRLRETGLTVSKHDAYTTSWTRRRLGVKKTHVNDALCLGSPTTVERIPATKIVVSATGRGDRQMLRPPDRHGNPRGAGYRAYCALPRQRQGYTRCPGHRDHRKRVGGIVSGDLVRLRHRRHGLVQGYATLVSGNTRVAIAREGRQVSVRLRDAVLLSQNCGYRTTTANNDE